MPRTPTSGIVTELTRSGSYPGFAIEFTVASGAIGRVTTLDIDCTVEGNIFAAIDVQVTDIGSDGTVGRGATVRFGDQTIAYWVGTLYREFDDAAIRIWLVYADAPGESQLCFTGRCGKPTRTSDPRTGDSVEIALDAEATTIFAPRQRVQDVIDQKWLVQAGSIFVLASGQKWVIDRQSTSNT